MNRFQDNSGTLAKVKDYLVNLKDSSPYWRVQAAAWGILLVVAIAGGSVFIQSDLEFSDNVKITFR